MGLVSTALSRRAFPALARRRDIHGLTVLRYRAPRNCYALFREQFGDLAVTQGFGRVFGPHELRSLELFANRIEPAKRVVTPKRFLRQLRDKARADAASLEADLSSARQALEEAVTLDPGFGRTDAFGLGLPGVLHLRHTHLPEHKFTVGEPENGAELANDLQRFCDTYGGGQIAAVIVEPVAGSTGVLVPPKGYLERLRQICD